MKFLRMKPGHGEVLLAEGDPEVVRGGAARSSRRSGRQLDAGHVGRRAADGPAGRREAQMVKRFDDVPRDADRVIFFPRAAGGC